MLTDLYASINVKYNATLDEGLEFMRANNTNGDQVLNTSDFETIFSNHLSTGTSAGYRLFNNTYGNVVTHQLPTTTVVTNTAPVTRVVQSQP
jgi:hypothetical protein